MVGFLMPSGLMLKSIPIVAPPPAPSGACLACSGALDTFAPARGRDGRVDEDAFFTDRFCSHGCYHSYARRTSGRGAMARWN